MDDETPYSIGHADRIGLVVGSGIIQVEYDLKQVQDDGFVLFQIDGHNELYETEPLSIGDDIHTSVLDEAIDIVGDERVYGFVVPDHLLARVSIEYPTRDVFRQQ